MTGPGIRDLLDSLARAMPEAGPVRDRARDETLELLVAIFGPPEGEPDAALEARISRAADAILAERSALPRNPNALAPTVVTSARQRVAGVVSRRR
ncbi:hypothetical protein [Falsiroseomonas bella]|uniref:hypothetical protein n=1 Tax=Falsiroseomonas bella TaxID=2184016 RepID=UPI0011B5BED8|nr:hypothetical protein [Falsiroseomonas bella]